MMIIITYAVPLHFQLVVGVGSMFGEEVATGRLREVLLDLVLMEIRRVDEGDEDQDDIAMTTLNGTLPEAVVHVRAKNSIWLCSSDLSCAALRTPSGLLTISVQFSFTESQLSTR